MHDVIARRQHKGRRRRVFLFDQRKHAGGIGLRRIDPPDQAGADERRIAAVARGHRKRHAPGRHDRLGLRERRRRQWIGRDDGRAGRSGRPAAAGAGAMDCGGASARICANDRAGDESASAAAAQTAATPPRRKLSKPHPDIAFFLDHKRGNFMPRAANDDRRGSVK